MFIRRKKYEWMQAQIEDYERLKNAELEYHDSVKQGLEKEVQRLAALISARTEDCHVGPWCKDCIHRGTDGTVSDKPSVVPGFDRDRIRYISSVDGDVMYCKKHIHEICPEFEHYRTEMYKLEPNA